MEAGERGAAEPLTVSPKPAGDCQVGAERLPDVDGPVDVLSGPSGRRHHRGRWLLATAAVVVAALAAGVIVLTRDGGPSSPRVWDPRVVELVSFVETHKGATFKHPVRVVYLDLAEFKDRLSIDDRLSDAQREQMKRDDATLRALGLQGGKGSLVEQTDTIHTEDVTAFYDRDRREIVIPAAGAQGLLSKATLVHELTHALQDQLGQLEDLDDSEAEVGRRALAEGEAEHLKTLWIKDLSERDRERLEQQQSDQSDDATADLEDVNPVMVALFSAPYSLGQPMAEVLDHLGRLDDAFEHRPNSSADVLDPTRWLHPVAAFHADAPALTDGEHALGSDETLGAHELYLMLAGVLDPADALEVVDGWRGDRMQSYRAGDGTTCARVTVVGVNAAATGRLRDAIETWTASRPDGAASSKHVDGGVQFDACDRGTARQTLTTALADVPGVRAALVSIFVDDGADVATATCVTNELIRHVPLELLTSNVVPSDEEQRLVDTMVDAQRTCRGTG